MSETLLIFASLVIFSLSIFLLYGFCAMYDDVDEIIYNEDEFNYSYDEEK